MTSAILSRTFNTLVLIMSIAWKGLFTETPEATRGFGAGGLSPADQRAPLSAPGRPLETEVEMPHDPLGVAVAHRSVRDALHMHTRHAIRPSGAQTATVPLCSTVRIAEGGSQKCIKPEKWVQTCGRCGKMFRSFVSGDRVYKREAWDVRNRRDPGSTISVQRAPLLLVLFSGWLIHDAPTDNTQQIRQALGLVHHGPVSDLLRMRSYIQTLCTCCAHKQTTSRRAL